MEEFQNNEKNAQEVVNNRKRSHASRACLNCRKIHAGCGKERPCNRCVAAGWQATCRDVPRKKRRSKVQLAGSTGFAEEDKLELSEVKEENEAKYSSSSSNSPDELMGKNTPVSSLGSVLKKTPRKSKKRNSNDNTLEELNNSNINNNNNTEGRKEFPMEKTNNTPSQINPMGLDPTAPPFRIPGNNFIEDDPFQRPTDEMFVGGMLSPNININPYAMRGMGLSPSNNNMMVFNPVPVNGNSNNFGLNISPQYNSSQTTPPLESSEGFVTKKEFNAVVKEMQLLRDRNLFLEHKILGITNELSSSRGRQEQLFSMVNTIMRGSDQMNSGLMMGYFRNEDGE